MATEPTDLTRDAYYSPWRIRKLLPDLLLLETGLYPVDDPDPADAGRRGSRPHWWGAENALNIAADLKNALRSLDPFTRMIVWRAYVEPDPTVTSVAARHYVQTDTHIATILRCKPETVKRHRLDGVEQMASFLGWQPVQHEDRRRRSETVWRNPKLNEGRQPA